MSAAEISAPLGPIIANKESTGAASPSPIPICKSVPALKDSNSIVALSVSISAKISPSSITSPTFLSHVATVPSSIVSESLGIFTTITPSGKAVAVAVATTAGAVTSAAETAASAALASEASWAAGAPPDNKALMSSPFSPIMAKSASTGAASPS